MTRKRTPEDITIEPRDLRFDMSAADDGRPWLDGNPVATAVYNAMSLTFPDGERMFMDAVKAYRGEVSAEDVKDFITQEAIHSREHHLLNNKIDREKYPVAEIEAEILERVNFGRAGGPMRMLMATICLEHFTSMMADLMFDAEIDGVAMFSKTDPALERLWRWHAMEETEHKAVAYDAADHETLHCQYRQFLRQAAGSRRLYTRRGRPRREAIPLEETGPVRTRLEGLAVLVQARLPSLGP